MASISAQISEPERAAAARRGHALPDGSYPTRNCDEVRRAIESYGRAPESHRLELAAMIRQRCAELRCPCNLDKLQEA